MPEARQVVCPHCATVIRVPADRPAAAAKCGGCHLGLFEGQPIEVDEAGFEHHIRGNGIPVLLDVWAPWCGPCRTMAPAFAQAEDLGTVVPVDQAECRHGAKRDFAARRAGHSRAVPVP